MGLIIKSGSSGTLADVDLDHNLAVTLPSDASYAGFAKVLDGEGNAIQTTESGALLTSEESLLFAEQVDGAVVNTLKWNQATSGMTIAQSGGFIALNSGLATTANAYAILSTLKFLPMYGPLPLRIQFVLKTPIIPQSNVTQEVGLGSVSTNLAPTDGVFFRWSPNGSFLAVVNNGGTETTVTVTPPPVGNVVTLLELVIVEDRVLFRIGDTLVATISNPVGICFPTNAGRIPLFARVYNSASVPSQAPQINIGQVIAVQQDMKQNKPWGEVLASIGLGFYQSPLTPFAQTANHANSAAPASITLSNTAAGYTTLGGKFAINSQAAGATDGIVFAFQNEAGYQRIIRGVKISTVITGIAVVTATVLDWAIGVNGSAISLATADGAGAWAARRIPVGVQGFTALSGI